MPTIWMTMAMQKSACGRPYQPVPAELRSRAEMVDLAERARFGGQVPDDEFPRSYHRAVPDHRATHPANEAAFPPFFHAVHHFLTGEAAACLAGLDLGSSSLIGVRFHDHAGTTLLRDDVFLLVCRERKRTIDTAASTAVGKEYASSRLYSFRFAFGKDVTLCILPECLEGPDIWTDPHFGNGIYFLSDRARTRFHAAGLAPALDLQELEVGPKLVGRWHGNG